MAGIFYGIGTGPGDPELMTIKAIRTIRESEVIALPVSDITKVETPVLYEKGKWEKDMLQSCMAYQIAVQNVPEINEKAILLCPMPMCKEKSKLKFLHDSCAKAVAKLLKKGQKVSYLTLGDPTVYSTYLYLDKRIRAMGYKVTIINGIPSFCASAARLGIGLVENKESLHIIPSSYGVEEEIQLSGTKVLMKAGKKMAQVKQNVLQDDQKFYMVENCGMQTEKIYTNIKDVPEQASYYSLMILKEEK